MPQETVQKSAKKKRPKSAGKKKKKAVQQDLGQFDIKDLTEEQLGQIL